MARHRKVSKAAKNMAALGVMTAVPATSLVAAPPEAMAAGPDWGPIIECESGGDPQAQNSSSTASGLFQFIDGTWKAYGGSTSKAKHASVAEQYRVANKAFAAEGYNPWNASKSCWGGKIGSGVSVEIKQEAPKAEAEPKKETPKPQPKKEEPKVEKKAEKPEPKVETKKVEPKAETVKKTAPVVSVPDGAKHTDGGDGLYTVKTGDTLSSLAKDNGTTVDRLMELNKDIIEMPDWIFVGERIHLS